MRIVFRTDSSAVIGTGHVMRCLALAERLAQQDNEVLFVSRALPGNVNDLVRARGIALSELPATDTPLAAGSKNQYDAWLAVEPARDAAETIAAIGPDKCDWLVIDHYGIDTRWEKRLRSHADQILVIDDLANRAHDCDLLTEQNYRPDAPVRYAGLTPATCRHLIGPEFALLQPSYSSLHVKATPRSSLGTLLVFYGGIDATCETERALEVLETFRDFNGAIDVVVGAGNRRRRQIEQLCDQMETTRYYCQTDRMPELMVRADLALGAGGVTSWERCCLGLPAIITAVADNQIEIAHVIARQGAGWFAGTAAEVSGERLCRLLQQVITQPERLAVASRAALKLGDGRGVERILQAMIPVRRRERARS